MDERPGICVQQLSRDACSHIRDRERDIKLRSGQKNRLNRDSQFGCGIRNPDLLGQESRSVSGQKLFCAGQSRPMPIFGQKTICEFSQKFLQIPGLNFLDIFFVLQTCIYTGVSGLSGYKLIYLLLQKIRRMFSRFLPPKKNTLEVFCQ